MHVLFSLIVFADSRSAAQDFGEEAKLLYKTVACGGEEKSKHCDELRPLITAYQEFWKTNIEPTLAKYVPRETAKTVVYPFGGGDSVTALGTYPNVTDLTSLSLEPVGDPRGINKVTPQQLDSELKEIRKNLELLFRVKHSKTDNMSTMARGAISGQLVFALVAEVVRGYEPVALRYFSVLPDGTLDWLTEEEAKNPSKGAFNNAEIEFRRPGEPSTRLFRHIAANLDNEHLAKDAGPVNYLKTKGRVMTITKAASYLLWWENFTSIRQYLLENMDYMISDSTGVPPDVAKANGFKQYTFGVYEGPFLGDANSRVNGLMKQMWKQQPQRPIDFRYGYPDSNKNAHMLITTKLAIAGLE